MSVFEYKGLDAKGRPTKGTIDADSSRTARQKLKLQGVFPTEITETREVGPEKKGSLPSFIPRRKVSVQDLSLATRQLSTLVSAGIPLVEALKALQEQSESPRLIRVFSEVTDLVNEGSTLAKALDKYPSVFPKLYVNMVASAEASGTLDLVLERLAELLEKQAELRGKVISAFLYPAVILSVCFVVLLILLGFVVPQITVMYTQKKQVLPLPTQIVIIAGDFVRYYWWLIIIGLAGIVYGFRWYNSTPSGKRKLDQLRLKLPVIGVLNVKVATARFARTLGTMFASGVELLTALSIVRNIVDNVIIQEIIDEATVGVREGKSLASELSKSQIFPKMLIHLVKIGEKTGHLEDMLLRAASTYETEIDTLASRGTRILEPFLILFLAIVVGGVVVSVMLPMLQMGSFAQI